MRRWVVLLVTAVLLLGGCGDGGGELAAYEIVARAAETTAETGTARFEMTVDSDAGGMDVTLDASGVMDMEGQRMSMTMTMPEMGVDIGELSAAMDGTTMYMRFPMLQGALGVDTEWISMDVERLAEVQGFDLAQLQAGANNDPTQTLQALRGASDDVEEVGTEEVRGVPTTHYRGTMDLRKAAEQQGVNQEAIERLLDRMGTDTMPMDVWIDDDGLARRMRMSPEAPDGSDVDVTMELFDYGTDEPIGIPSPDQVTDVTDQILAQAEDLGG